MIKGFGTRCCLTNNLVHWLHHGFGMAHGIFGDPSMELGMVVFPSWSLWSLASILGKLSTQFECHEMRMIRHVFCLHWIPSGQILGHWTKVQTCSNKGVSLCAKKQTTAQASDRIRHNFHQTRTIHDDHLKIKSDHQIWPSADPFHLFPIPPVTSPFRLWKPKSQRWPSWFNCWPWGWWWPWCPLPVAYLMIFMGFANLYGPMGVC